MEFSERGDVDDVDCTMPSSVLGGWEFDDFRLARCLYPPSRRRSRKKAAAATVTVSNYNSPSLSLILLLFPLSLSLSLSPVFLLYFYCISLSFSFNSLYLTHFLTRFGIWKSRVFSVNRRDIVDGNATENWAIDKQQRRGEKRRARSVFPPVLSPFFVLRSVFFRGGLD